MITKKEITKEEIKELLPLSYPVENHRQVLDWLVADVDRSIRMSRNMKAEMTAAFGKFSVSYRGLEFRYSIWVLEFEGDTYQVFCSKRGTTVQAEGFMSEDRVPAYIKFLEQLQKRVYDI